MNETLCENRSKQNLKKKSFGPSGSCWFILQIIASLVFNGIARAPLTITTAFPTNNGKPIKLYRNVWLFSLTLFKRISRAVCNLYRLRTVRVFIFPISINSILLLCSLFLSVFTFSATAAVVAKAIWIYYWMDFNEKVSVKITSYVNGLKADDANFSLVTVFFFSFFLLLLLLSCFRSFAFFSPFHFFSLCVSVALSFSLPLSPRPLKKTLFSLRPSSRYRTQHTKKRNSILSISNAKQTNLFGQYATHMFNASELKHK